VQDANLLVFLAVGGGGLVKQAQLGTFKFVPGDGDGGNHAGIDKTRAVVGGSGGR
jgi:hypothetical protein